MKRYSLILLLLAMLATSTGIEAQNINSTYTPSRNHQQVAGRQGNGLFGGQQYANTENNDNSYQNRTSAGFRLGGTDNGRLGTASDNPVGYDMHSTTVMPASGSRYSSSLTEPGAASVSDNKSNVRRKGWGTGGGEDRPDPYQTPIGSLPLALMLLLATSYARLRRRAALR